MAGHNRFIFHHETISIADVGLKLLNCLPLAEYARDLLDAAHIHIAIKPILYGEVSLHVIIVDCRELQIKRETKGGERGRREFR